MPFSLMFLNQELGGRPRLGDEAPVKNADSLGCKPPNRETLQISGLYTRRL
jgi:hypothetical protein